MEAVDHELTFCSEASGWMNAEFEARPELPFGRVKIEQSKRGSPNRRDLTLWDRSGKIAITGEVKLPYMADGGSPFNESVVEGAHTKASKVGAEFFITWNVNRIVLWRTDDKGKPLFERHIHDETLTQVRDSDDLVNPSVEQEIRRGLLRFLERASQAYTGQLPLTKRPLDEFFITVLEASLERPITLTQAALTKKCDRDGQFKVQLDAWMRDIQQWHLSDDELVRRDNVERAAKFACYVLVNRIVFYEVLRKKYTRLPAIRVPARLAHAAELHALLADCFDKAKKATRDYETVFDGDFGDALPFQADEVVSAWRDFVESNDRFDFTQINYDVIGPIFQRLVSDEERHRYGQHYTKAEIVDLIEAFCIRTPEATVLDPACGGGTFLVRAYNRKKFLAQAAGQQPRHEELLGQLFGVDISAYAAHLTTINLATRDLIDQNNYPLVAQSDFFDVEPGEALFQVPMAAGSASKQLQPVIIPQVDAVVGNPPYVRQEEISKPPTASAKGRGKVAARQLADIKAEADAYKKHLMELARRSCPGIRFSGRSDLHVYFWPHATGLLKPGGYYGFLTSSQWLDVEYGFRLQEFLLNHYAIVAVFESQVEPWFTGARVTTCATILRRETDPKKRDETLVRFVQLRSPLSAIFAAHATEEDRQRAAETLRDRVERTTVNTVDPHWRVRVVKQGELYRLGCGMPAAPEEDDAEGVAKEGQPHGAATGQLGYVGGKWGLYLRAPDLLFDIMDTYGHKLVPLCTCADVRFGLKTGCDKFFYLRDVTGLCLAQHEDPRALRARYGIQRTQTDSLRIVLAGDGSQHVLEAKFLEPEIHSLMEIASCRILGQKLERKVFLCKESKTALARTYALEYIRWGERQGFHRTVSVATRGAARPWYDVTDCIRPQLILPKIQQYRHIVPLNSEGLTCNSSLLGLNTALDPLVLAAILNSTLTGFVKWFYGRQLGNEGNLQIDVYAAKNLPVPDPRHAPAHVLRRLRDAMSRLADREVPDLDEDLATQDRQELDEAVFELLGEPSVAGRRNWVSRLHAEILTYHAAMKEKERIAMRNRAMSARGSTVSVEDMAKEIWDSLDPSLLRRFPEDFFDAAEPVDRIETGEGKFRAVSHPLMGHVGIEVDGRYTELGDERRVKLVKNIHEAGRHGAVPIPRNPNLCATITSLYRAYHDEVLAEFTQRVAEKTASEKMQAKVVTALVHRLANLGAEAGLEA